MRPLHRGLFDIFALALPRGHGFGDRPPIEAWESEDSPSCAVVTRHIDGTDHGVLVMRRRIDQVWTVTCDRTGFATADAARACAAAELKEGQPREALPPGVPRRPALHDLGGRPPSEMFRLLCGNSHRNACWLLNQLYLSLPRPDRNWASECQTGNFHTRLWEAQLLASFREQGILVTQPEESPDFRIENRLGGTAWVEAVTANPEQRYEHVNARPVLQPEASEELFFGAAALRFAKTIGSKLQRRYDRLPHVSGQPFVLALADFHAPASMIWSREALIGYLTGFGAEIGERGGNRAAVVLEADRLLGEASFPAGLFRDDRHSELSAILFTNACTLGKLNRVAVSSGAPAHGLRYVRYGKFADPAPGALDGIPFCLDVGGAEYLSLWPQRHEPWCAELEVFHNPFARHPLPDALLPEAAHWRLTSGEWNCRNFYPSRILWSGTLIMNDQDPVPTYETVPAYIESVARRRMEERG